MTKNQIRKLLIDKYDFTNTVLDNYKKKQELADLLSKTKQDHKDKEEQIPVEDKTEQCNDQSTIINCTTDGSGQTTQDLTPDSPEWTQYVLSHFEDDELEGKNPKVDGLRRMVGLLLGTIVEEGCNLVASPCGTNEMRACVKAWIVIRAKDNTLIRYEALADAYSGNCTDQFNMYITALADTRAKGRCFRNALKLKQVIAAEESQASVGDIYAPNTGKIDQGQIKCIDLLCKRNDLDLKIILDSIDLQYELDSGENISLSELSNSDGRKILQKISRVNLAKGEKE